MTSTEVYAKAGLVGDYYIDPRYVEHSCCWESAVVRKCDGTGLYPEGVYLFCECNEGADKIICDALNAALRRRKSMSYRYKPDSEQQTIFPFTSGEKEAAIICPVHRHVNLTEDDYKTQLSRPNDFWACPICGSTSDWDDDNYDVWLKQSMGSWQECKVCNGTGTVTCKRCNGTGWVGGLAGEICCDGTDDCPACEGAGGVWVR